MPLSWIRFKRQGAKSTRRPTSPPSGQSRNSGLTSSTTTTQTPFAITSTQVTTWTRPSRAASIVIQARGTEQVNAWLRGHSDDAIIALRDEQLRAVQERRKVPPTQATRAVLQWRDSPSQSNLKEVLRARDRARSDSLSRRPTTLRPPPPTLPRLAFQPLSDMIADAGLRLQVKTAGLKEACPEPRFDVSPGSKSTDAAQEKGRRPCLKEAIPRPRSRLSLYHELTHDSSDSEGEGADILPLASGLPSRAREIEIPLHPEVVSCRQIRQRHPGNATDDKEEGAQTHTLPIRAGCMMRSRTVDIPARTVCLNIPELDITDESRPRAPAGCSIEREEDEDKDEDEEDFDTDLEYEIVPEVEEPESPPESQSRWSPDSSDDELQDEEYDSTACEISIDITPPTPPPASSDDEWMIRSHHHLNLVDTEGIEQEDDEESLHACLDAWSHMLTHPSPVTPPAPGQQEAASLQSTSSDSPSQQSLQTSRYLSVPGMTYHRPRASEQHHPSSAFSSGEVFSDGDDCEYYYDEEGTYSPQSPEAAPHLAVLKTALSLPESTSFERLLTLIARNVSIARYLALNRVPSPTLPPHVVPQSDELAPTELRAPERSRDLYAEALRSLLSVRWPSKGTSQALPHILEDIRTVQVLQYRFHTWERLNRPDAAEAMALDHLRKLLPSALRAEKRMSYAHVARLSGAMPLAEVGKCPDADHVIYAGKTEQFVRLVEAGMISRQQLLTPGAVRAVLGIPRRMERVQETVRRRRLEGHDPSPLRSLV